MSADVQHYISIRPPMRADITRSYNKIVASIDELSIHEVEAMIERLTELQENIKEVNSNIIDDLIESESGQKEIQDEYDRTADYTEKLLISIKMLRGRLNILQPQQMVAPAANTAAHDHHASRLKLKLPQIPMPSYGHKDGEDLHKFFLNFENIIL